MSAPKKSGKNAPQRGSTSSGIASHSPLILSSLIKGSNVAGRPFTEQVKLNKRAGGPEGSGWGESPEVKAEQSFDLCDLQPSER